MHITRTKRDEFCCISPGCYPANARYRQFCCFTVPCNFCHHIESNRLDRWSTIAAMGPFTVYCWLRCKIIEINRNDGTDSVNQTNRVRTASFSGTSRVANVSDIWGKLNDHWHTCGGFAPTCYHFNVFWHLTDRRTHAALTHAVGATKIQFNTVGTCFLDKRQNFFPGTFFTRHHNGNNNK